MWKGTETPASVTGAQPHEGSLQEWCHGGPLRWPETVTTKGTLATSDGQAAYVLDQTTGTVTERVNCWQAHTCFGFFAKRLGFLIAQGSRVDGNANNLAIRIDDLGHDQRRVAQFFQARLLIIRQTAHVIAGRLVAEDQRVGLAAMDQR